MDQNTPSSDQLLRETYRLARENNEMLHRMRRTAFVWGILRIIIYAALLIAPIWFYVTYLNGTVQNLISTYAKVEGVNVQAQSQLQTLENSWQEFQSKFGTSTSATH